MKSLLFCCFFLVSTQLIWAQAEPDASEKAYLSELYQYLHLHPELSFQEKETSAHLAIQMREAGFEVTENVGGYGLVCVLKNGKGPTVLLRTDTDALPIVEATGLPYASTVMAKDDQGKEVGVMHACGHDVHMSVWVGTARKLASLKKQWKGTLIMIAQPAEERSGGAIAMLGDGLYEKYGIPDYALALHASPSIEAGSVGFTSGYALANVDMMDITVKGKGGHGAYPHTTHDPVVLSARIIMGLQTIVSREISPLEPAVVTVGSIHGGTKGNVIPNEVKMELTMRSYSDEVRNAIIKKIERICEGVAMSAGIEKENYPVLKLRNEYTPALYNDPALTARVAKVFESVLGEEKVKEVPPVMAGEDFGRYGRTEDKVPIFLFWLGTVAPEKIAAAEKGETSLPSLHNDQFAPLPFPTLTTGVECMSAATLELFGKK